MYSGMYGNIFVTPYILDLHNIFVKLQNKLQIFVNF